MALEYSQQDSRRGCCLCLATANGCPNAEAQKDALLDHCPTSFGAQGTNTETVVMAPSAVVCSSTAMSGQKLAARGAGTNTLFCITDPRQQVLGEVLKC